LETKLVEFNNKTSIQIAVVILDDLGGEDAKVVVDQLGDKWGVGQEGLNNGIVFMIVKYSEKALENMTEKKRGDCRIAVADGLGEYLTDIEATSISNDVFIPYAKNGDYYKGIDETVNTMLIMLGSIGWEQRQAFIKKKEAEDAEATREFLNGLLMTAIIIGIIVLITVLVIGIRKSYLKKKEVRERRASFKQRFEKVKLRIESQKLTFPPQSPPFPAWALLLHNQSIDNINSLINKNVRSAIDEFPGAIETNMVRADHLLNELNFVAEKLEVEMSILQAIPAEVGKYDIFAPALLKTAQDMWDLFSTNIQNKQKQGYRLLYYDRLLEGFKNDLSQMDEKLKLGNEESRYVYETSKTTFETIDNAIKDMRTYLQNEELTKQLIISLTSKIKEIPAKRATAQKTLDILKAEYPKENWEDLDKLFGEVPALLSSCTEKKEDAELSNGAELQDFTTAKSKADDANATLQRIENLFQDIQERKDEIINAKANYVSILESAKTAISSASSKCSASDVEFGAKLKLVEAEKKLKSAESEATESLINWLACIVLLTAAKSLADEAYGMAKNDVDKAARERARVATVAATALATAKKSESYSRPSSINTGFTGFGGGRFGGGGGGGSW
jgi:uncharacterized membrane protein YgcG